MYRYKLKRLLQKINDLFFILIKTDVGYARHKGVVVGENCRIIIREFGTEPWLISIGNNVTISDGVKLLTHDGSTWLINDEDGRRYLYRRVKIGNNVFIGVNSVIMPGVVVEDNVIIAAGSIVTKSVPSGFIVGGNPAKKIGTLDKYQSDALKNYVSDKEMDKSKSYMDRINAVVDSGIKNYLE
ncbi:MAG TPA: acyltransferase [Mucilaginibacter sp.]|nr:acyltransferase [Mucilaginibacter sp.]